MPDGGMSTSTALDMREFSPLLLYLIVINQPPDEAMNVLAKLLSFRRLQENWDSYGTAKPSERAIRAAMDLVQDLDRAGQNVYFVAPGPNGEVVMELKREDRSLEIYIDQEGNREYVVFEGSQCVRESPSISDVYELIAAIG